jgi:hypothetical protein
MRAEDVQKHAEFEASKILVSSLLFSDLSFLSVYRYGSCQHLSTLSFDVKSIRAMPLIRLSNFHPEAQVSQPLK